MTRSISDQLSKASAKDTYIFFMDKDERDNALKEKRITGDDIKRVGPPLTAEEKEKLFSTMSFIRILFLVSKASLGKTELELEGLQNNLKELQEWIGKLNDIMAYGTELNAKKDDKDRKMVFWDDKLKDPLKTLNAIKNKFGEGKIDLSLITDPKEGGGWNTDRSKGMPANIAIEKIRNISTTLDNEVKTNSTKIQKVNNQYNTLIETASFTIKKNADSILSIISKL